jgi:hypothetical protein
MSADIRTVANTNWALFLLDLFTWCSERRYVLGSCYAPVLDFIIGPTHRHRYVGGNFVEDTHLCVSTQSKPHNDDDVQTLLKSVRNWDGRGHHKMVLSICNVCFGPAWTLLFLLIQWCVVREKKLRWMLAATIQERRPHQAVGREPPTPIAGDG